MRKTSAVIVNFLLVFTLSGCTALNRGLQEDKSWSDIKDKARYGEVLEIIVENEEHDLVPICGQFLTMDQASLRVLHDGRPPKYDEIKTTILWSTVVFSDGYVINFDRKKIYSVEFCLKNTPDRRPLYKRKSP